MEIAQHFTQQAAFWLVSMSLRRIARQFGEFKVYNPPRTHLSMWKTRSKCDRAFHAGCFIVTAPLASGSRLYCPVVLQLIASRAQDMLGALALAIFRHAPHANPGLRILAPLFIRARLARRARTACWKGQLLACCVRSGSSRAERGLRCANSARLEQLPIRQGR